MLQKARDQVFHSQSPLNLLVPGANRFVIITPNLLRPESCAISAYLMGSIKTHEHSTTPQDLTVLI